MENLKNYTLKEISEYLKIDINKAKEVKKIVTCKNSEYLFNFRSVRRWVDQCYNNPSKNELKMCALNEVLQGYGTEGIEISSDIFQDSYYGNICGEYVNMGDTYTPTIVKDHITGKFNVQISFSIT